MKIIVTTNKYPQLHAEVDVYSLTYEFRNGMFLMHVAPPGQIFADRNYKPYHIHLQSDKAEVFFSERPEAEAFVAWLKKAEAEVHKSFVNMPD